MEGGREGGRGGGCPASHSSRESRKTCIMTTPHERVLLPSLSICQDSYVEHVRTCNSRKRLILGKQDSHWLKKRVVIDHAGPTGIMKNVVYRTNLYMHARSEMSQPIGYHRFFRYGGMEGGGGVALALPASYGQGKTGQVDSGRKRDHACVTYVISCGVMDKSHVGEKQDANLGSIACPGFHDT